MRNAEAVADEVFEAVAGYIARAINDSQRKMREAQEELRDDVDKLRRENRELRDRIDRLDRVAEKQAGSVNFRVVRP